MDRGGVRLHRLVVAARGNHGAADLAQRVGHWRAAGAGRRQLEWFRVLAAARVYDGEGSHVVPAHAGEDLHRVGDVAFAVGDDSDTQFFGAGARVALFTHPAHVGRPLERPLRQIAGDARADFVRARALALSVHGHFGEID